MPNLDRLTMLVGSILLLASGALVLFSLTIPLYLDEIGWRILYSRYFLEDGHVLALRPQCTSRFVLDVPWHFIPWRMLDAVVQADVSDPRIIRLQSWACLVVLISLSLWLLPRIDGRKHLRWWVAIGIAAILGIGVTPLTYVIGRPETVLLICIVLFTYLAGRPRLDQPGAGGRPGVARDWFWAALLVVLASFFLSRHAKAVFFLPLILLSLWAVTRTWTPRLLSSAATIGMALTTALLHSRALECPENRAAQIDNDHVGIPVQLVVSDPSLFVHRLYWNLADTPAHVANLLFQDTYFLEWLPGRSGANLVEQIINLWIWTVVALLLLFLLWRAIISLRHLFFNPAVKLRLSAAYAILVACGSIVLLQGQQHFYDSSFLLALLALASYLLSVGLGERCRKAVSAFLLIGASAALVSQIHLAMWLVPRVDDMTRGRYFKQSLSVSPYDYEAVRPDILETAAMCNIPLDGQTRRLVTDNVTYPVTWRTREPIQIYYITNNWSRGIEDTNAFLRSIGSDGVLVACRYLRPPLTDRAMRNGDFCCVPSYADR